MSEIVTQIAVPMVNSNGTSRAELSQLYRTAWSDANALLEALMRATPHGRDYQGYATDAEYKQARAEHLARISSVQRVVDDLYALVLHVRK